MQQSSVQEDAAQERAKGAGMITTVSMTQEELDALPKYVDVLLKHEATERVKFRGVYEGPHGPEIRWFLVSVEKGGKLKTMQLIEVSPCASMAH